MKTRIFFLLLFLTLSIITTVVHGATTSQSAIIKGNGVNLRAQPDYYSYVITVLQQGLTVIVIEQAGRWYKVQLSNGEIGWIYQQYIELNPEGANPNQLVNELPVNQLLDCAKSFLGIKYVYGGDTPKGFDCSGFTMYVFSKSGIRLPHQADLQIEHGSEIVAREDLLPGDLVFFMTEGSEFINHVGIYLGDHKFIHASSGFGAVRISPLDKGYYYDCYEEGRRLINSGEEDELDE